MKNIKIRQYQDIDQETVFELHKNGLKQTGSSVDNPDYDIDFLKIKDEYINNRGEFLVVLIENKIIGMGALRRIDDKTAEIKRMRVDIKYQGQGVGGLILDKLINKGKQLGYKKLILDTTVKQATAQKLYQSRGFKEYDKKRVKDLVVILYKMDLV